MTTDEFREFLLRWQRWYFHDHSLRGLGIAQSSYAERIGQSSSTADPALSVEPEIGIWHEYFRSVLPEPVRQPLWLAYLVGGLEKAKYPEKGRREYYARLDFARETARVMFNRALIDTAHT